METKAQKPNIFAYHDYRKFLKEWFDYLKKTKAKFSLRRLASEAKFGSGYLSMVLSGSRNLSSKAFAKIFPHLDLNQHEKNYLEQLIRISDSDVQAERLEALEKLQKFRSYQQLNPKEIEVYQYLRKWYYVAIREMALLDDFKAEAEWIQNRLRGRVPLNEVKQALEFLQTNGYINPKGGGVPPMDADKLKCVGGVYRIALGQFHRQMLAEAADSIDTVSRSQRNVSGHTMAISQSQYEKLKKILDGALEEIAKLEDSKEKKETVYHVTLAAFPLTKKKPK